MMRLGVLGPTDPDSFADNIGHSLVRMGHSVEYLGPARPIHGNRTVLRVSEMVRQAYPTWEARQQLKVVGRAIDCRVDAVISTDARLAPEAVALLRRNRINIGLWFPDSVANLERMRMFSAPYTALFLKDELLVQRLRDVLAQPAWYLPEACNPEWHRPIGEAGVRKHIVVVGNTYLSRLMLLQRLHREGIPLKIYGSPIPRWAPKVIPDACHAGRLVHREEKSRVFREAAGVLNNLHPAEMTSVNARLFEAAGAGAAVLCEGRPSLSEHFEVDREVLAFTRFEELVERARELVADSNLAKEVGDAASKRAHADHAYEARLTVVLEKLT
jgi:spore maturation protein CgeB